MVALISDPMSRKSAGFCISIIPYVLLGTGTKGYMVEMLWHRLETRR